jgi:integrase
MGFMEASVKPEARTVKVQVRHSADCKDKAKGSDWRRCKCLKILRVYEGGGPGSNRRISTRTRSWEKAEEQAQQLRDSWDPDKVELKRLKADKESKQVTIEEAVTLYIEDMVARLGDNGTVAMARSLLGHMDSKTRSVEKPGHLFLWLEKIPVVSRPAFIADFTSPLLTQWRASWKFADYTAAQRWGMVRSFFNFCEAHGWIQDSPARKLRRMDYESGSRTAIFTDKQYEKVLEAVADSEPENVPSLTREAWQARIAAFVEMLRWSGMALIDAVQYRPEQIDLEGVLRYRRQKTGELATVPLPKHVVVLLRNVPLERDSLSEAHPFRMKNFTPHSDTVTWRKRLMKLFTLAGIKEVRNELGKVRSAHPHMLRDTFAVWNLRHGVPLHAVAKMLGHSDPSTTAKAYLPWVKELEQATIAEGRAALDKAAPKPVHGRKVVDIGSR